jgi:hypothetical protein
MFWHELLVWLLQQLNVILHAQNCIFHSHCNLLAATARRSVIDSLVVELSIWWVSKQRAAFGRMARIRPKNTFPVQAEHSLLCVDPAELPVNDWSRSFFGEHLGFFQHRA